MLLLSETAKEALKSDVSDRDYLRSKVVQPQDTMEHSGEDDDVDENEDINKDDVQRTVPQADSAYESGDKDNISKTKTSVSSLDKKQAKASKTSKQEVIA